MAVTLTGLTGPDLHITDDQILSMEIEDGSLSITLNDSEALQRVLNTQLRRQMDCWDEDLRVMRDEYRFDLTITDEDGQMKAHVGVFIGQVDWSAFNISNPDDVTVRVRIPL